MMRHLKWLCLIVISSFVPAQKTFISSFAATLRTKETKPSTKLLTPSNVVETFEQTLKEALLIPQWIDDAFSQSKAFSDIAEAIAKTGEKQKAVSIFNQALQTAQRIENAHLRLSALSSITINMAGAGLSNRAFQLATTIENAYLRSLTLSYIAVAIARSGEKQKAIGTFNQALQVAQRIKDADSHSSALFLIATAMAKAGFLNKPFNYPKGSKTLSRTRKHFLPL